MSVVALSYSNKNQYRSYPLKQESSFCSLDGITLPQDFIVDCSITTTYGRHKIYIKQISRHENILDVAIADTLNDVVLGVFSGEVLENFTTLNLVPLEKYVSGQMTIGSVNSMIEIDKILNFSSGATELEESTIFCYLVPAVHSISDQFKNKLTGHVAFGNLVNLTKTTDNSTSTTKLTASYPETVVNKADKSSRLGNCQNPVIKNINGITPLPVGEGDGTNDGNIYLVGIKPVVFYGASDDAEGSLAVSTPGVTLDSLCASRHKLLPPTDIQLFTMPDMDFDDLYYNKPALAERPYGVGAVNFRIPPRTAGNFNSVNIPEYYFWPQFVREEYINNLKYWPQPS